MSDDLVHVIRRFRNSNFRAYFNRDFRQSFAENGSRVLTKYSDWRWNSAFMARKTSLTVFLQSLPQPAKLIFGFLEGAVRGRIYRYDEQTTPIHSIATDVCTVLPLNCTQPLIDWEQVQQYTFVLVVLVKIDYCPDWYGVRTLKAAM